MSIPFVPSPNFSSRRGCAVEGVIIHYTASGGTAEGDIAWFLNPASKASAHFVIARDGATTQLVQLEHAAWHAGASRMRDKNGANLFTIGVELDNCGLLHRGDSGKFFWESGSTLCRHVGQAEEATLDYGDGKRIKGWWEPYAEPQLAAFGALLEHLRCTPFASATSDLVGHEEISTPYGRKMDPGPLFPWERFPRLSARRTKRA